MKLAREEKEERLFFEYLQDSQAIYVIFFIDLANRQLSEPLECFSKVDVFDKKLKVMFRPYSAIGIHALIYLLFRLPLLASSTQKVLYFYSSLDICGRD